VVRKAWKRSSSGPEVVGGIVSAELANDWISAIGSGRLLDATEGTEETDGVGSG